jgi:hypothetical protein
MGRRSSGGQTKPEERAKAIEQHGGIASIKTNFLTLCDLDLPG